jgi:hypothetical protein
MKTLQEMGAPLEVAQYILKLEAALREILDQPNGDLNRHDMMLVAARALATSETKAQPLQESGPDDPPTRY